MRCLDVDGVWLRGKEKGFGVRRAYGFGIWGLGLGFAQT